VSNIAFNIAKGAWAYYATLPATNDAIIAVPIETTGVEADGTLQDYDNLSVLLAAANNEQTTMGRKTCTGVTVTTDDSGNKKVFDCDDIVWTTATGNPVSKLVFCYDPDTTTGSDTDLIPLFAMDFVATPAGGNLTYQVNAAGIADAS
jgi:hypothetical protein